ncbi:MAG: OsmC family protein, partial [Dongiaceae bacterium]
GIFDMIDAVKTNPSLAAFRFRAANQWVQGGHNRSTIKDFYGEGAENTSREEPFVLDADEPPALLGKDKGAAPLEFVLHALAACLTTTLVYHAASRGMEIKAIDSKLEGDLDLRGFLGLSDTVRKGYQAVRVTMRVKSDVPAEKLSELAEFSPTFDIVSKSLPVTVSVETY